MDLFKKDLFSVHTPKWLPATDEAVDELQGVLEKFFSHSFSFDERPSQVGAFEINSSNFKVSINNSKYLVKRWDKAAETEKIQTQLQLLLWLHEKNIPVPKPLQSITNNYFVVQNERIWGVFDFLEGEYFKGTKDQLCSIASSIGSLTRELKSLPQDIKVEQGPRHLRTEDREVLRLFDQKKNHWGQIIGPEHVELLHNSFNYIVETWDKANSLKVFAGKLQVIHYDLHPHNILMSDSDVVGILDFDACAVLEPGVALGFSIMKLVRQAMAFNESKYQASELGALFIAELIKEDPEIKSFAGNLKILAKTEVLRRITLILKLNLENSDRRWNHVLPVQIGHLYECDQIFGK